MLFLRIQPPPGSTLFPYTTLFRSRVGGHAIERYGELSGAIAAMRPGADARSEEHTSELKSRRDLVCRLLLEKKKAAGTVLICMATSEDKVTPFADFLRGMKHADTK